MELYIQVSFWVGGVALFLRCFVLALCPYPRDVSANSDIAGAIVSVPFLLWAAYLLWGAA